MNAKNFISTPGANDERLRIFSVYADFAAASRIRWASARIAALASAGREPSAEMWSVSSVITTGSLGKIIVQEAAAADLLIVAMSSLDQREIGLMQWLELLPVQKKSSASQGLLIGLFGDDRNQAGELEWAVSQFSRIARESKMNFIWSWMAEEVLENADWLTGNVTDYCARKRRRIHAANMPAERGGANQSYPSLIAG